METEGARSRRAPEPAGPPDLIGMMNILDLVEDRPVLDKINTRQQFPEASTW
jgi:hypothetical protein